jgi:flagellar hook-associated protein 2
MATSPLAFVGVSQFSQDFQTILNRTLTIAAQPIARLQKDQVDLVTRKQLLGDLRGAVAGFGASLAKLGQVAAERALVASSSNSGKVSAVSTGASAPATYTLSEITSVARGASATTAGYADASTAEVSGSGVVRLTVGGQEFRLTLGEGKNNLAGLRDAINGANAGVTATVLTTGTGATPYYLSVTANTTGLRAITLTADPETAAANLLAAADPGANTEFKINGAAVSKPGRLINDVVSGLTFTVHQTTGEGETVTLTLASDRGRLSSALREFVEQYNGLVAKVDAQVGPAAGLLTGNFLVRQIADSLREVGSYTGGRGAVKSLANLGVEFDSRGKAVFHAAVFDALPEAAVQDAFVFLGSETSGLGGLSAKFTQLSDPVAGLIKLELDQNDRTDQALTAQIATLNERLKALQASVSARLQAADALLAGLESQQRVLDASLKSLNLILFGKNKE